MTMEERAWQIMAYVDHIKGPDALAYVRDHLKEANKAGVESGREQARQAINNMFGDS